MRHQRPISQHLSLPQPKPLPVMGELEELELQGQLHQIEHKFDLAKLAPVPRVGEALDLAAQAKAIKDRLARARAFRRCS